MYVSLGTGLQKSLHISIQKLNINSVLSKCALAHLDIPTLLNNVQKLIIKTFLIICAFILHWFCAANYERLEKNPSSSPSRDSPNRCKSPGLKGSSAAQLTWGGAATQEGFAVVPPQLFPLRLFPVPPRKALALRTLLSPFSLLFLLSLPTLRLLEVLSEI